ATVKILPGDDDDVARLVLQITTPRPSHDQGSLGALDDVTVIDRPLRHSPESVLVDQSALIPLPGEDAPADDDHTVIVKAPARAWRATAPARDLRFWQVATLAALFAGVGIGLAVARAAV